jgi:hypothetical protein
MSKHVEIEGFADSTEHEALIRSVLLGELPASDERIQRLEESCPPCSAQLQEHAQICAFLDEGGDLEMQSVLEEAKLANDFPGDEQVESVLRSLAANHPVATPGGGRWRFRSLPALVAAAAIVLAVVLNWSGDDSPAQPTGATHLGPAQHSTDGDQAIEEFGPQGQVDAVSRVHWGLEIEEGQCFELRIYDNTGGTRGALLIDQDVLEPEWTATEKDKAKLQGELLFEVILIDADFTRVGSPFSWSASSGSSGSSDTE